MLSFFHLLNGSLENSILLLLFILILLSASSYIGKFAFKKRQVESSLIDDEVKIILGVNLSILGLLIAFILSISISGYNSRQQSQEMEAIAIGNAYQRSDLLPIKYQKEAKDILKEYLDLRVVFFKSYDSNDSYKTHELSLNKQTQLWNIASKEAITNPTPITASVLSAYGDLYSYQQKTMASWRFQIPLAAWILLILFSFSAQMLIGYNVRGVRGKNILMLILPILISLALFMIAEIDAPEEGLIHVIPDDLEALKATLSK